MIEIDAYSFTPGKLESRNEVAIPGDDNDGANQISECQPCNVETDSQVNSLLLDGGNEIACLGRSRVLLYASQRPFAKLPSASEGLTLSQGKIRFHF